VTVQIDGYPLLNEDQEPARHVDLHDAAAGSPGRITTTAVCAQTPSSHRPAWTVVLDWLPELPGA
jgi:hypothetical protein